MEKVLIIDDNPTDRMVQKRMLEPKYEVKVAQDPYEAEEIIKNWQPDIVVIDYAMPKMNGIQAIRYFKEKLQYDGIYLMLTGLDDISIATESIRGGAFDYIVKPLVSEVFNHKIRNCINYKKLLKSEKEKIASAVVESIILSIYYELKPIYDKLEKLIRKINLKTETKDEDYVELKKYIDELGMSLNKLGELDQQTKQEYVESILDYYLK